MKYTNLITIAIPVFERTEFFLDALESATSQSIKCKIIVVDNNSSHDFFEKICKKYNIEYYKNEENIGMFPNWNRCISLANTEFVIILGDDDILNSNYIEQFLNAFDKHNNIDIFYSNFEILENSTGTTLNHNHTLPYGFIPNGEKILEYGIKYRLGFPIITSAIRKSKFTGFYEIFHASNDWAWIYENAKKLIFFGNDNVLLKYRYHKNNDSKNNKTLINIYLSIWYLYGNVFKSISKNKFLKDINKGETYFMLYVISNITNQYLEIVLKEKNKYIDFLKDELNNRKFIKLYLYIPHEIRKLIFKLLFKLKIIK